MANQWRQEIARRIAPSYASNPHVDAIILAGSTARGHADRYSDIEIGVFWNASPADDERRDAIVRVGGDIQRLYAYDPVEEVWCDDFIMGRNNAEAQGSGVLVELVHCRSDLVERVMGEVLVHFDTDLGKQNLLAAIDDGIALHNPGLIHGWKSRIAVYPDGLAAALINRHAVIDHFWSWQMWLERGPNRLMLADLFCRAEQKILVALLALNHAYYHRFKWPDEFDAWLRIAPPGLIHRLNQAFTEPPAAGAQVIIGLVEETYDLVEHHLPQVDVERLRRIFHYQRPFLDEPPHFEGTSS